MWKLWDTSGSAPAPWDSGYLQLSVQVGEGAPAARLRGALPAMPRSSRWALSASLSKLPDFSQFGGSKACRLFSQSLSLF